MISKTGAALMLALALAACLPACAVDASDADSFYRSQLDDNGLAVYDAVSARVSSTEHSLDMSVEFPTPVLQSTAESAEKYAVQAVNAALAALYYDSPLLIWLWDLPLKTVDVSVSTEKAVLSGDGKEYYIAVSVSFTLESPSRYSGTPVQDAMRQVEDACSGLIYSGNDAEKAKSIYRHLSGVSSKQDAEGEISDIHDAVCGKSSSSAGVAAAFTYIAAKNGLGACTVKGLSYSDFSDGVDRYWNSVLSGGSWYAVDVGEGFVMAGSGTKEGGDVFGSTHVASLDMKSPNGLRAPDLARAGYEYLDETPFFQRYGAYVLVGVMSAIVVAMLYVGVRNGSA
ncbi:MAG: hypothetical protein J5674_05265 [Candidatus Methanomethylophilaceae archaeon]|nr:hypothetical protein [Candidatus Methanomethylophilaceae archaeon]